MPDNEEYKEILKKMVEEGLREFLIKRYVDPFVTFIMGDLAHSIEQPEIKQFMRIKHEDLADIYTKSVEKLLRDDS